MLKAYKTALHASQTELVINKSRFIGRCFPANDEEAALALLNDVRKQHSDATHNCFAYRIGTDGEIARFSDDGEPGGTAGLPMMEVLIKNDLTDTLCIVTRYFGGTLLGAGGLVRAYSRSASDAVRACGVLNYHPASIITFSADYARYGGIETFVRQQSEVQSIDFLENVMFRVMVENERTAQFIEALTERTDGRSVPQIEGEGYIKQD